MKKDLSFLLLLLLLLCLPGLPGGTDSLWARAVQPRPISSPHSDKMEGLWRRNRQVCERRRRGGKKIHTKYNFRFGQKRRLIASGSAATAGKLNKRCHTVALPCRSISVQALELCTHLGVAPTWPGSETLPSEGLPHRPIYQPSCRRTGPTLDGTCETWHKWTTRLHSWGLKMQILMGFILKVCIS